MGWGAGCRVRRALIRGDGIDYGLELLLLLAAAGDRHLCVTQNSAPVRLYYQKSVLKIRVLYSR